MTMDSRSSVTAVAAEGTTARAAHARPKRAEQTLRELESELAHINRVSMMGELAASLAHEITQPVASARNNARAVLNFLDLQLPDLGDVREALACVVGDVDRAEIIDRMREQIKKASPRKKRFDRNAAIASGARFRGILHHEVKRNGDGAIHLGVHHRRPWGPAVGRGKLTSRRRIAVYPTRRRKESSRILLSRFPGRESRAKTPYKVLFIDWLTKVTDDPVVQDTRAVNIIRVGRHEDCRNRPPCIDEVSVEFDPGHRRHMDVGNQAGCFGETRRCEEIGRRRESLDGIAQRPHEPSHRLAKEPIIFNDRNQLLFHHAPRAVRSKRRAGGSTMQSPRVG
jgi:hypothetical protein